MRIIALAGVAMGGLLACQTSPAAAPPTRPNVIYMLADDLGYRELGAYGQTKIRTPHLDRVAAEGVKFTQHYSGSPVCAPSRAALLTGRHTGSGVVKDNLEFGGWGDDEERGQMPLPRGTFTLARMFQGAGYTTGAIGKWGLGGTGTEGEPNEHGFDYFFGYMDQKQAHNYYPTHLWRNGQRVALNNPYFNPHQKLTGAAGDAASYAAFKGQEYSLDVMADDALRWIREQHGQGKPFFLYLPFTVPHLALQVPDSSLRQYEGAFDERPYPGDKSYLPHPRPFSAYAAMISQMDAHVGRVMALLRELGIDDRTLVMFSSDNGATYTGGVDAAYFQSVGELRGLKGSVYEGGIRVPLIARWPGRIPPGTTSDAVTAFWDMLPTFADVIGVRGPSGLDGVSFMPQLLGASAPADRPALYWEYHGLWKGAQAVRLGRWKGVRLGGHERPDAPIELYDLVADPSEVKNLAADHPDVVARVREVMQSRTPSAVTAWNFKW